MITGSEEERRSVAYHEAAHAVVAYLSGKDVARVRIYRTESGAWAGDTTADGIWTPNEKARYLLGAGEAEDVFHQQHGIESGNRCYASVGDGKKAEESVAEIAGASGVGVVDMTEEQFERFDETYQSLQSEAKQLVTDNWRFIQRLAESLLAEGEGEVSAKRFQELRLVPD